MTPRKRHQVKPSPYESRPIAIPSIPRLLVPNIETITNILRPYSRVD